MKTVTKTALANARQNRTRNMISGAAIILTTLLIFMVLTVGYASVKVRFAAVNAYYPPYHAMFRQVSEEDAGKLKSHNDMEEVGLRFARIWGKGWTMIPPSCFSGWMHRLWN